jgi:hypothetical protein
VTEGERLVWAAVFARAFDTENAPRHVVRAPALRAEYERTRFQRAIEAASHAVDALRASPMREHESRAALRLREMLA